MFTGIIEEVGKVKKISSAPGGANIEIECSKVLSDVVAGDSIAVNGVCLTVTSFKNSSFTADVSAETLSKTSLESLTSGRRFVNLERAMSANGRFGGHMVQGHVDGRGRAEFITKAGAFWTIGVRMPDYLCKYIAVKGSVALDGISLTVADEIDGVFTFAVIPHTFASTNLSHMYPGDSVNVEVDVVARYLEKLFAGTKEISVANEDRDKRLMKLLENF